MIKNWFRRQFELHMTADLYYLTALAILIAMKAAGV